MQSHPWITQNGKSTIDWGKDVAYAKFEDPTEDEQNQAMTKVKKIQ